MRGSSLKKLIWIGPISENVSHRVIRVLAKFHAYHQFEQFWSITARQLGKEQSV